MQTCRWLIVRLINIKCQMDPAVNAEDEERVLLERHVYQVNDNLLLRPVLKCEAQVSLDLVNKNRERLGKWLYWVNQTKCVQDEVEYIEAAQQRIKAGKSLELGLFHKPSKRSKNTGCWSMIGMCGFVKIADTGGSLGYWIDSDFAGQGIITTCCRHLTNVGLQVLNLDAISIDANPDNTSSVSVAERLGFVTDGVVHNSMQFGTKTSVLTFKFMKDSV